MRVRFLITSLDRGGAEKYLAMTARGLAARGHDVGVACLRGFGPVASELADAGIPVRTVGAGLVGWLRRERPQILYGFLFHATIGARMAGRLAGVPVIVSSEQLMAMERGARMLAYRATWDLCDHYVAVAGAVRDFLRDAVGIPARRVTVIPSGLDPSRYRPATPAREPVVASIGHLRRNDQKGYRFLVEASKRLPDVRFIVAGEGTPPRDRGRVEFVGPIEDVSAFLAPASLYVQPSRWEGFPNAVIEAMACGLPVVATRVAGMPEQVADTGWIVPPADAEALAAAIGEALGDRRRLAAKGRAARDRVEREYSEARLVDRHAELFERLVANIV